MGICTHLNLYFLKFYFTSEFKIIFHHVNAGTFIISKHVPGEKGVILIMLVTTFFFILCKIETEEILDLIEWKDHWTVCRIKRF